MSDPHRDTHQRSRKSTNPVIADTVWHVEYGNGKVYGIDWDNMLVAVEFYGWANHPPVNKSMEMDDFFGMFDEQLNQWVITPI